jgi:hypothetical protein
MDRSDERFGIVHAERVDPGAVGLSQARATETSGGVELLRMVAIAEVECTPQNTDRVVVRLFAPGPGIRYLD